MRYVQKEKFHKFLNLIQMMQQNLMYNRKLRIMRSLHQIQRIAFRTKQVQMKQIQTKKSLQRL